MSGAFTADTYKSLSTGVHTSGGAGNVLCCASQTHKNRQGNCNGHLSSDLGLPVLPSRLWPPAPHCQSVLHTAQGLTSVEQTSAQQAWQVGALVSQGTGQAHHQEGAPGHFTLVTSHREQCHQSWSGGGKDNCALGEWGGRACILRRSQRPQLGRSKRSLLQHKGIKALHWASCFSFI